MPQRLTDRDEVPEIDRDNDLITALGKIGQDGAVFHSLRWIPDQYEDFYTILVDDRIVVKFEVDRKLGTILPESVETDSFEQYRRQIGQGKDRIKLDKAAAKARARLSRPSA